MTESRDLPGLSALARIVDPVAERFAQAGHRLYLVGGVVRDLHIAQSFDPVSNDIDLTTDALPAETKRLLSPLAQAIWSQGERFGTIGAKVNGHPVEITTHRAEAYDEESRKPAVTFGQDLAEDLSRRDFTINAAAIELPGLELHDPYRGIEDLRAGILRTPLSPDISFTDDPLRMMRAARFIARFSLTPSEDLIAAAATLAERLSIVSVERTADEFERLLLVTDCRPGFDFLETTGLFSKLFPQFPETGAGDEARALAVRLGSSTAGPMVRRAGTLWPIRDRAGEALIHLRYSRAKATATTKLLAATERGLGLSIDPTATATATAGSEPEAVVRGIAAEIGFEQLDVLIELAALLAANDPAVTNTQAERLRDVVTELRAAEDLGDLGSPLTGAEIMEILELGPGPEVGLAQKYLKNHRLRNGPFTASEARQMLLSWARDK